MAHIKYGGGEWRRYTYVGDKGVECLRNLLEQIKQTVISKYYNSVNTYP